VSTGSFPLRITDAAAAAALNRVFARAGFAERPICERLDLHALDCVDDPGFKSLLGRVAGEALFDVLARVFVFGARIEPPSLAAHLAQEELEAFLASDLIRPWESGDLLYSPVRLVPVQCPGASRDLLLGGDRGDHPDGSRFEPFPDIVFSGHNPLTRQFLKLLPRSPSGDVLDLCAGTGIGALAIAPFAERCTAADIAERSVHFARFNAWLNQCERLEALCGSLYEPVPDRRFDRILAHPPYVPALERRLTYRDGGESGDEIVQGVIRGLPDHLKDGGTFHLLCLGMDTLGASFEQRVRAWLGDAEGEFDIVFALDSRRPPESIALRLIDSPGGSTGDLKAWRQLFERLQVKEFVYGALAGRRFGERRPGEAFTRRVLLTDSTSAASFERLFRWFDWLRQPGRGDRLMTLRPKLPTDLELEVIHRVREGALEPASYTLVNGAQPFQARIETEPWIAAFLAECDGVRTAGELLRDAEERRRVPPGLQAADMAQLMEFLIERGCLLADL
jgi:SAM-dependent methyltransferase